MTNVIFLVELVILFALAWWKDWTAWEIVMSYLLLVIVWGVGVGLQDIYRRLGDILNVLKTGETLEDRIEREAGFYARPER